MRALGALPSQQWPGYSNPPAPTTQEATLEVLALMGELTDDWNAEIHAAHEALAQETRSLAAATAKLDTSTRRLDFVTRFLITATAVLALVTLWHVVLLLAH